MPPPTPSTAPARSVAGTLSRGSRLQDRLKIDQKIHHILGSIFDPFWEPCWCHVGSLFAPFLVSDPSWTLIFIKNVDVHEKL